MPVMGISYNPPYSKHSLIKGEWRGGDAEKNGLCGKKYKWEGDGGEGGIRTHGPPCGEQLLSRQPDSTALAPLRKSVRQFIMPRTGLEPVQAFTHKHLKLACLPIPPPRHPILYIIYLFLVDVNIYCLLFRLTTIRRFFLTWLLCSAVS